MTHTCLTSLSLCFMVFHCFFRNVAREVPRQNWTPLAISCCDELAQCEISFIVSYRIVYTPGEADTVSAIANTAHSTKFMMANC